MIISFSSLICSEEESITYVYEKNNPKLFKKKTNGGPVISYQCNLKTFAVEFQQIKNICHELDQALKFHWNYNLFFFLLLCKYM
jgi:hypothetical protein